MFIVKEPGRICFFVLVFYAQKGVKGGVDCLLKKVEEPVLKTCKKL